MLAELHRCNMEPLRQGSAIRQGGWDAPWWDGDDDDDGNDAGLVDIDRPPDPGAQRLLSKHFCPVSDTIESPGVSLQTPWQSNNCTVNPQVLARQTRSPSPSLGTSPSSSLDILSEISTPVHDA
jgi:hypothetical protein